jgi:hypothetical protein
MLTIEKLRSYPENHNFKVVVMESPALTGKEDIIMFVARKLHKDAWCVLGLPIYELKRIVGDSLPLMISTVVDIGTKLTIDQYINDVVPHNTDTCKLYYL